MSENQKSLQVDRYREGFNCNRRSPNYNLGNVPCLCYLDLIFNAIRKLQNQLPFIKKENINGSWCKRMSPHGKFLLENCHEVYGFLYIDTWEFPADWQYARLLGILPF